MARLPEDPHYITNQMANILRKELKTRLEELRVVLSMKIEAEEGSKEWLAAIRIKSNTLASLYKVIEIEAKWMTGAILKRKEGQARIIETQEAVMAELFEEFDIPMTKESVDAMIRKNQMNKRLEHIKAHEKGKDATRDTSKQNKSKN